MKKRLFGTDGVRGVANQKLTPELALALGQGAGRWIIENGLTPNVLIGEDTRQSGPMLAAAVSAGLCSAGVNATLVGVCPTGGISYLVRTGEYALGIMISASHNPAPDNGIKVIAGDGAKLGEEHEIWIESTIDSNWNERPIGGAVGKITTSSEERARYEDFLVNLLPSGLGGMKILLDCAHGAAFELAPRVFARLGAEVTVLGASPNGTNINSEGGATKPEFLQEQMKAGQWEIGLAFDGDADRVVFSDSNGDLINGDRSMAIWVSQFGADLHPPVVVGTVMSNGGFEQYLQGLGIRLERTSVGDKYVASRIRETDARVGGEQSGHIIFPQHGPTGDGLVTGIEVLGSLLTLGKSAAEFSQSYTPFPQLMVNIEMEDREAIKSSEQIANAVSEAETCIAGKGRIVLRPSGTQPMVRVMVEAEDWDSRDKACAMIVDAIVSHAGGRVAGRVDLTHALGD